MHYKRLVIEASSSTLSLDLHPRLTVIAGADEVERDGLIGELASSLGRSRPGVHVAVDLDDGSQLSLHRPIASPHRVVDLRRDLDVTHRFRGPDDTIDVLSRLGLDPGVAARRMRMTRADIESRSREDEAIAALARVDQGRLWDTADKVRRAEAEVEALTAAKTMDGDEESAIAEVERCHAASEAAREDHERFRSMAFLVGACATACVLPVSAAAGLTLAVPLILLAITAVATSWWHRSEAVAAAEAEAEALAAVGASSYLELQVARVKGNLGDRERRRDLQRAGEALRAARARWELLAGSIPVTWALEHRRDVEAADAALRQTVGVGAGKGAAAGDVVTPEALAAALGGRRAEGRTARHPEILPVLLDDPLSQVAPENKPVLLAELLAASADQQLIYLTDDPDVAEWARAEAVAGTISLVEPRQPRHDLDQDLERSVRRTA